MIVMVMAMIEDAKYAKTLGALNVIGGEPNDHAGLCQDSSLELSGVLH